MEAVIQDCRLFYRWEKAEKQDAPTLLMLHGWGCDNTIFAAFEKSFLQKAHLLIVDFPGHGKSDEPSVAWGVPEYAEQIYALLERLNIVKADVVAHSFGGRVAIYLASHHPEKIGKMVITGGAGLRKAASGTQSKRQKQYKRLKALLNVVGKLPFLKGIVSSLQEKLLQRYGSPDYVKLSPNMRQTFVKVINQDLSAFLPAIQASTLLVWGEKDTETPLWMGQQMEKEIPDAGLVVFDGRSHFAFLEESQRFNVIVNTFLWGEKA